MDNGRISAFWLYGVIYATMLTALFALFPGLIVMLLWNWLAPAIFGLPSIGYLQGWGLVVLSGLLFKNARKHV